MRSDTATRTSRNPFVVRASGPATASSTRSGWPGATRSRPRADRGSTGRRPGAAQGRFSLAGGAGGDRTAAGSGEATFVLGERVTGLRVVGGRIVAVETHDGAVAAPIVVLATGPFLARTAALAGVDVPIAPTRRQKVVVPDAPEVPSDAPMTIDEATGAHWRPALRGAYVLLTERETPASEPAWSVPTSADFAFRLLDPGPPAVFAPVVPFWSDVCERGATWILQAGQYEYTPDHRPFIVPTPVDGLW